jgi:hypothetical protein
MFRTRLIQGLAALIVGITADAVPAAQQAQAPTAPLPNDARPPDGAPVAQQQQPAPGAPTDRPGINRPRGGRERRLDRKEIRKIRKARRHHRRHRRRTMP